MGRVFTLTGKALVAAASVLALFVVVIAALGVYLIVTPMRRRGLAPKYAAAKAGIDLVTAATAFVQAVKAANPAPAGEPCGCHDAEPGDHIGT